MRTIVRVICVAMLGWCVGAAAPRAQAQSQTPAPTSFEVASVKPSDPNASGPFGSFPMMLPQGTGRISISNMPLRLLIRMVYGLQDFQVVGGPTWQTSSKFDITAKAYDGTTTTADLMPLLKTLLADRFKLKTHMETREGPTYALVVARSDGRLGPDLKPSTSDCTNAAADQQKRAEAILKGGPAAIASLLPKPGETIKCALGPAIDPSNPAAGFGLRGDGQPMNSLTTMLTYVMGRPVNDKTGLTGLYDWVLKFDPQILLAALGQQMGITIPAGLTANANSLFADSPSLLTALQEQLGLKLDSERGPIEVLVIDSAEMPQPD
jgi:uncharacterized protein (TIGR03435 family)